MPPSPLSRREAMMLPRWPARRPPASVTRENDERIQTGMTREDVEAILGRGKEAASADGFQGVTWQGGFLGGRVISITFEDGRVAAKAIGD